MWWLISADGMQVYHKHAKRRRGESRSVVFATV